jgi:uncharacterized cupredoxin-like copper-binding protein
MRTVLLATSMVASLTIPALAQSGHGTHSASPTSARARAFLASSTVRRVDPRVVTVKTYDYNFQLPDTIEAGAVTFRIQNEGKELHHIWLVRLEQGKTMSDYFKAVEVAMKGTAPYPKWAIDVGGPNAAAPGLLADGTVTLAPGNYILVCHIPSPDGTPHARKGMVKSLTVVPSPKPATEPRADLTMTLVDYDFNLSAPLTAGKRTIKIVNGAAQPHEVFVARLAPGKTAGDALAFLEKMQGQPPILPMGGATGLANGRAMSFTANFEPGQYVLICFVPDAKDFKPHFLHGMVKTIEVK